MNQHILGALLTTVVALSAMGPLRAEAPQHPNVIVILTDDQGWGDLSLNGNRNLATPNMDALATAGARFERFFVQPVCSPTRAEFLTGRYHLRTGVRNVTSGGERLNLNEHTIAESFRAAGYATACFGKWHNGSQYPYHPNGRGFQEYYGFTSGHWGDYFNPPLDHNGQPVTGEGYLTDDFTNRAMAFIDQQKGKPFFCYLAYNTPHSPMQVPDPYWNKFAQAELPLRYPGPMKEDLGHTRAALAMCENLDDNIGRLLQHLEKRQLARDTIVVFFCDNGPNGWRWNDGLRGRKGTTDDGGTKSPLHIRWPAKIPPGTRVAELAGAIDLLPTLTRLAGIPTGKTLPLDGRDLSAAVLGQPTPPQDRILFQHWNGRTSARTERYRLDATGKLYDLQADPGQTRDLSKDQPERTRKLQDAVAAWRRDLLMNLPAKDDRPFPVGYKQHPRAVLPARDGVPQGQVKRSAPAPNCSFFTHWIAPEDRMTWSIAVETPGRYEAIIDYTCPEADLGSTIELRCGDTTWSGTVTVAHDPPLRGQENDRVPRAGESYVKTFRSWSLGSANVSAGTATLELKATKIPGRQVMDVRSVTLILQPE